MQSHIVNKQKADGIIRQAVRPEMIGRSVSSGPNRGEIPNFLPVRSPFTGQEIEVELYFGESFGRNKILTEGLIKIVAVRRWRPGRPNGGGEKCAIEDVNVLKHFIVEVLKHHKFLDYTGRYYTRAEIERYERERARTESAKRTAAPGILKLFPRRVKPARKAMSFDTLRAKILATGKVSD